MLFHKATGTQGHKVPKRVAALLTPLDLVVDLEAFERPTPLTSPPIPLQHPLHQPACILQENALAVQCNSSERRTVP
jgi:hypothetical protein